MNISAGPRGQRGLNFTHGEGVAGAMEKDGAACLEIQMLGGFAVRCDGKPVMEEVKKTRQLLTLLLYLIANRREEITQDMLIAVEWPHGDSGNPANALKNLVYRLRMLLKCQQLPSYDYILFRRGLYSWNNEVPVVIDAEAFEALYRKAEDSSLSRKEALAVYQEAVSLYKGDFLSGIQTGDWIRPFAMRYRQMYAACIRRLTQFHWEEKNYRETARLCKEALERIPFDEDIHMRLMEAYVALGRHNDAILHFEATSRLFYEEKGVQVSDTLRQFYREQMRALNNIEADLTVIQEELQELKGNRGAFFCEYEVFRRIYQMESRTAERSGKVVYLALLTVTDWDGRRPADEVRKKALASLKKVILTHLRRGDVVTQYSGTQYLLLLDCVNYENGVRVLERIKRRYIREYRDKDVAVHDKILPVSPG